MNFKSEDASVACICQMFSSLKCFDPKTSFYRVFIVKIGKQCGILSIFFSAGFNLYGEHVLCRLARDHYLEKKTTL